jgi:hypothetical protein
MSAGTLNGYRLFYYQVTMPISMTVQVTKKDWITNPKKRWQAGLEKAGLAWRQNLQRSHYGSTGSSFSTYARTGTLANKSNFVFPKGEGVQVDLISTAYLSYLLHGTGVHGPTGQPIRPGHVMAWNNSGNVSLLNMNMSPRAASSKGSAKGVPTMIFSMSSQGSIWEGKLEELITAVRDGFVRGVVDYEE